MLAQALSKPSKAIPSAGGLNGEAINVSIQCAIASIPVAAVRRGGSPKVNKGSQIADLGIKNQECSPTFLPSSKITIAPLATSLPVPLVVGIAINGATFSVIFGEPPSIVAYVFRLPGWVLSIATAFAQSMEDPPPIAIKPSHSCFLYSSAASLAAASVGLEGV